MSRDTFGKQESCGWRVAFINGPHSLQVAAQTICTYPVLTLNGNRPDGLIREPQEPTSFSPHIALPTTPLVLHKMQTALLSPHCDPGPHLCLSAPPKHSLFICVISSCFQPWSDDSLFYRFQGLGYLITDIASRLVLRHIGVCVALCSAVLVLGRSPIQGIKSFRNTLGLY